MAVHTMDETADPRGVFDRTDELRDAEHEMVVFLRDASTGLKAIVSVHDTTLGPALGGTRFYPYSTEAEALTDGLRLSQGMTFKAAAAGMPLGGGKAVIIGDPATVKTPELLRAYGRLIDRLGGTYITAADVGTTSDDLDVIGESTRCVVGRTKAAGGSGDSGFSTAYGVFCSMRAAAAVVWGEDGLSGRTVGVEGAGKVGFHLIGLLLEEGANVLVSDPYEPALQRVRAAYAAATVVADVLVHTVDVYAPCALGATLTSGSVSALSARVVCGAANNQLLHQGVGADMAARDILWVPDYVANAGGLIQVGGELQNRTEHEVIGDVERIADTVTQILRSSLETGQTTASAAQQIVEQRLSAGAARLTPA